MPNKKTAGVRVGRRPPVDARAAGEYAGLSDWTMRRKAYGRDCESENRIAITF